MKKSHENMTETNRKLPATINLMVLLVLIDVIATMTYFYLDAKEDPDVTLTDIENLLSFIFPVLYFWGANWLIRLRSAVVKYVFYIVFALEFSAFILDLEAVAFDIYSLLSLTSISALLGCIVIFNSNEGKKWFADVKQTKTDKEM